MSERVFPHPLTLLQYPQSIIRTASDVITLDFSVSHPSLLAAGLYDGSIAIYDIRRRTSKPILETRSPSRTPIVGREWFAMHDAIDPLDASCFSYVALMGCEIGYKSIFPPLCPSLEADRQRCFAFWPHYAIP